MRDIFLRPFPHFCHKVLPLVYDDSLSYYELLCKLIHYINDMVKREEDFSDTIAGIINELYELKHWFETLNVYGEIEQKLDNMAESGALGQLLIEALNTFPFSNTCEPKYLATALKPMWSAGDGETYRHTPNEIQGCASMGDGKVVTCFACNSLNGYPSENDLVQVVIYDVGGSTSNSVIKEALVSGLYHANGVAYNKEANEIYIACASYGVGETVLGLQRIVVLDGTTLSVKDSYNLPTSVLPEKAHNRAVTGVAYDNTTNKLYGMTTDGTVFEVVNETTLVAILDASVFSTDRQEFSAMHGMFYFVSSSQHTIQCVDIESRELVKYINLPDFDVFGHGLNYLEGVGCDEETFDIYVTSFCVVGTNCYGGASQWRANYIHKINPVKNVTVRDNRRSGIEYENARCHVDSLYTGIYSTGTSSAPFKNINEALISMKRNHQFHMFVTNRNYDEYVRIDGINLWVEGSFTCNSLSASSGDVNFENTITVTGNYANNHVVRLIGGSFAFYTMLINGGKENYSLMYIRNATVQCQTNPVLTSSTATWGINARESVLNMGIRGASTMFNVSLQNSQWLREIIPNVSDSNIAITGACKGIVPVQANKRVSGFYGRIALEASITAPGSSEKYMTSMQRRFVAGASQVTVYFALWFGVITATISNSLEVTNWTVSVNATGIDVSKISFTPLMIYLD